MSATVLLCGNLFDGVSETLSGPMQVLVEGNRITSVGRSVERPPERAGNRSLGPNCESRIH